MRRGAARGVASLLAIATLLVGPVTPGRGGLEAQDGDDGPPSLECCVLLLIPVGSRASAMGGSNTALSGPGAAFRNPAGLAELEGGRFVIHHLDNVSINTQVEAFTLLLRPFGFTFGVSYQLFDKGDHPTTDPSGMQTGELALRDHLVVASIGVPLPAGFSAGLNYRYFQERIDCTGVCGGAERVATANAFDVGARYRPPWDPALQIGIALVNLGPDLQGEDAVGSSPLPSRIHLGAAYDVLSRLGSRYAVALRIAVDARDRLRDLGSATLVYGLELDLQEVVFVRAGYVPGEGLGTGAAVGFELRYDRFDVGVSRSFVNSQLGGDTEPFQVSFGLSF